MLRHNPNRVNSLVALAGGVLADSVPHNAQPAVDTGTRQ